jgi:hypothetical protein
MGNGMLILHPVECVYLYIYLIVLIVPVVDCDAGCWTVLVDCPSVVLVYGILVAVSVMMCLFVTVSLMMLIVCNCRSGDVVMLTVWR